MFEIRYRITDDIKEISNMTVDKFDISDIDGFFQLKFNNNVYGEYNDITPLEEYAYSFVYITKWFKNIVNTALLLVENEYVAINDTESYNTWIEFKRLEEKIIVSIIQAEKEDGEKEIKNVPPKMIKYSEWKDESINFDEFRNEIVNKVSMYIDELVKINSNLMISKELKKLKCSIDVIKRTIKINKINKLK